MPSARRDPAPRGLKELVRDVLRASRGHDLALYSAGVTFYAAISMVPLLLIAFYLAGHLAGADEVRGLAVAVADRLPPNLGARAAAVRLTDAGQEVGLGAALAALVPASLYAEGLVRAFDRLSAHGDRGRRTLRGRLGSLVLVSASPLLLLVGLATTNAITGALERRGGLGPRLLGVYLAFLVTWLAIGALLAFAYRGLAPEEPGARTLAWGALGTGSVVAGTSLGYLLFLNLRVPLDTAYGGVTPLAAAAVSLLWLYLLHVIVLVGYVTTLRIAARRGRPLGPVLDHGTVRVVPQLREPLAGTR